jgi:transposase
MYAIHLEREELLKINNLRFFYPSQLVQKRLHAVYLKHKNYSNAQIADFLDIHSNTVTNYIKMYKRGGIAELEKIGYGTNKSELFTHETSLREEFTVNPPHSANEAAQRIKEITGLTRNISRIKVFMTNLGLKYRKTGQIPSKADPIKQKEWLENELEPIIEKAKNNECHLFFMDAAHFVMGAFLCNLWSFVRIFIKTSAGRHRLNILGAVNAITKEITFFTNTTTINALVICDFLIELRTRYKELAIFIVLDNARYQHCNLVIELAKKLNITLLFLPSYSPNLNIIERLWKYFKRKILRN